MSRQRHGDDDELLRRFARGSLDTLNLITVLWILHNEANEGTQRDIDPARRRLRRNGGFPGQR